MSQRSARSARVTLTKDYQPSDMQSMGTLIAQLLEEYRVHEGNRVHEGGLVGDPTTPSSQATGTGNTLWNINIGALIASVGNVPVEIAAAADTAIHSGSFLTGFTSGKSCVAAVVLKNVSGTITCVTVKGTPATTGSEVGPDDATIQTAVGANNNWIKLAETTLNRTGDTTVTQSHNNAVRPLYGMTAGFSYDL
jgi:hypothetical protein